MAAGPSLARSRPTSRYDVRRLSRGRRALRIALCAVALLWLSLIVVVPLAAVLAQAFQDGVGAWWRAVSDSEALGALRLSFKVALIAVPLNTVFGIAAAWLIARFRFPGRSLLLTLLDLPLSVSPVVSGLVFVLLFGAHGWLGPWLQDRDIQIIFALPGIVLATTFITLPMVAREILPLLESQGDEQELAALTLGASPWQMFWRVSLPGMRWAVLYGVLLTTARALGEFGAVSVVSGHIRGETTTLPLHVEILHSEYHFQAAFAVASILTLVGVVTLIARRVLQARIDAPAAR